MRYQEIAARLTGFSVPLFGVSWDPPEPDVAIARRVLAFLEDRRVLYNAYHLEVEEQCAHSVTEIRHFLTNEIGALDKVQSSANTFAESERPVATFWMNPVQAAVGFIAAGDRLKHHSSQRWASCGLPSVPTSGR